MGNDINSYAILIAKPEEKGPRRIYRRGWEDGIQNRVDWIDVAQDRTGYRLSLTCA
jgi:hypothetical protein